MKSARVYKTEAIVLRHRRLGEADKVLTLFAPHLGKFDAVAKGVRRPSSRKSGHVEILAQTSLLIARGRTLDIVTQSQTIDSHFGLREDLERLSRALYVVELVDRFSSEGLENYPLYCLLLATLQRLTIADDLDLVLRYFESQLLAVLGYQPELRRCVACHTVLQPVLNYYSAVAGGVICSACRPQEVVSAPVTLNALKVLRLMQGSGFPAIMRVRLTPALLDEVGGHLRRHLRHLLERDVRSLEFLQAVHHHQEPERVSRPEALAAAP